MHRVTNAGKLQEMIADHKQARRFRACGRGMVGGGMDGWKSRRGPIQLKFHLTSPAASRSMEVRGQPRVVPT